MQSPPSRIYAFDHLKTVTMLSVLFCHVALTYIVIDLGISWPFKDPHNTSLFFDIFAAFVVGNSMPIFFTMSGFMTAMLFTEKGVKQMIKNRLNRIVYPFLAGLLLLYPITAVSFFVLKFTIAGSASPFSAALTQVYNDQFEWRLFRPIHLWFLYYLILFCFAWAAAVPLLRERFPKTVIKIYKVFGRLYRATAAPLVLALITFIQLRLRHQDVIEVPGVFGINFIVLTTYAVFFGFGWLLYAQRENLDRFKKGDVFFVIAGFCIFFAKLVVMSHQDWAKIKTTPYILSGLQAIMVWFFIFGFIGLFLRYFNKYSALGRYLSGASYWIYLIHFPIVFSLQALFINHNFNVYLKFLVVVSLTLFIAIVSYHYLVRDTFIGQFLNGKKQKKVVPASTAQQVE